MSESAGPAPPAASSGAPGYDPANPANGSGHMPPPPLPPVIIPQNTNPIPTAMSSPMSGQVMSPTSASGGGFVRRAAPEPNKRALYVGGLDPRVTEDVLKQIFETTGHVQSVKIIPDKNVSRCHMGTVALTPHGAFLENGKWPNEQHRKMAIFNILVEEGNWDDFTDSRTVAGTALRCALELYPCVIFKTYELNKEEPGYTWSAFGNAGPVDEMEQEFQSKGYNYGFVEYDDPGAAERAMATLNGRRVHQSEIRVNWAYQSNNAAKEDTSNHFHIFVGDLSNEVNDEVLLQAFSAFGAVSEARVMWDMKTGRSRGYGFVAFRERPDAEKALSSMDGEWLGSRAIRCNWANQKGQPSIQQQQAMAQMGMTPTTPFAGHHQFPPHGAQSYDMVVQQTPQWQTTCYVGNLTPYTAQTDLVPLFQNFGYVVETRFQSDRGFAFIKMDTHENAAMAICQLSGYNVNGRPLKCSWGKDRPPTQQFDNFSPAQGPNSAYPQTPAQYFPQYGGPGGPMSPAVGPNPAGQPFAQNQGGFGGPGMAQPYQQMPQSAGGYGRGQGGGQWGQPPQGNFGNGFGGYSG